jgi:uncharacterized protein
MTIIGLIILVTQIMHLQFEGSYRVWFEKESNTLKQYDDFRATFGSDDSIIIAFKDEKGIFNEKALTSIQTISQKMARLPNIGRVDSILNYQYIHTDSTNPEDIIVENFIPNTHLSNDELVQKKEIAIHDPLTRDLTISKDGKTAMIAAKLLPSAGKNEEINIALIKQTNEILKQESEKTGYKFYVSGAPAINAAMAKIADDDANFYIPIALGLIVLLLWLFYQSFLGIAIPMTIVISASIVTLSIQYFLGLKLNNFTINIPIFITAIGIADAVHFYIAWINYRYQGMDNQQAIRITIEKNLLPMTLTTVTTAIAFATLIGSNIVPVSTLGIAIATGTTSALIFTLVIVPALLFAMPNVKLPKNISIKAPKWFPNFNYAHFVIQYDKTIILVFALAAAIFLYGLLNTKIDSNVIKYFTQNVDVRQASDFTMHNITGSVNYEIIVDSGKSDGIKDPKFLTLVNEYNHALQEHFPEVRHTSSLFDIIQRFQQVMNPEKTTNIPSDSTQDANAQYLLMYSLSLPQGMEINDKVDISSRKLRITAQVDVVDSSRTLQTIAWSRQWWKTHGMESTIVGQVAMFAQMEDSLTSTLIYSIISSIILIAIIMMMIIRNIKLLILFLIPNLFPILFILGLMGWLNIPIDVGIAISAAIIIGLAVDDTIYLFTHYFQAQKFGYTTEKTFNYILEHSGSAMVFTTLILSAAFIVFMFSDFVPNVHFSIMTVVTLIIALLCDLLLAPALISLMKKNETNKKDSAKL